MDALNLRLNLRAGHHLGDNLAISLATGLFLLLSFSAGIVGGASYRTENFLVTAPSKTLAHEIGDAAEQYRRDLAYEWLGESLPRWSQPCPITAQVGQMGAGGATSFMFERGVPFGWRMSIQGSRERILDSVLPHEVTHTIFATHFGRPLPRWADEGACTTVEHQSERTRQDDMLLQFLKANPPRSIPFNQMYRMTEYPHDILPLYAQGHSVARFLLQQGGKRKFIDYVGMGMQSEDWDGITQEFYGYRDLSELQLDWIDWVAKGSPDFGGERSGRTPSALASSRQRLGPRTVSTLTITTPLPPLLRPTDNEIESVRNAMNRDAREPVASLPGSTGDSWYSRPIPRNSPVEQEPQRTASAPRSLLPAATYPRTAGQMSPPTVPSHSSAAQWHRAPAGGPECEHAKGGEGGRRLGTFKPELVRPKAKRPIYFDAPTEKTYLR